jgi:hypothetical protein
VICIRDVVYSQTQHTEHLMRYHGDQHIHVLDWEHETISRFLNAKLSTMDDRYFAAPDANGRGVEQWLGLSTITNEVRKREEPSDRYLLRHTRLIPRDVVAIGNDLANRIARQGSLTATDVRASVRTLAKKSGREQLLICANQIAAEMMPEDAAAHGYDHFYTGESDQGTEESVPSGSVDETPAIQLHSELARDVSQLIGLVRYDRFGQKPFDRLRRAAEEKFGGEIDLPSILWQNGLLGYINGPVREGQAVFYRADREDELSLPTSRGGYALHPVLIDAIDEISGVGAPIHP